MNIYNHFRILAGVVAGAAILSFIGCGGGNETDANASVNKISVEISNTGSTAVATGNNSLVVDKSGIGNETNVKTKIPAEIPKAGPMVADADGNLYIADSSKCSIIKVTPSGEASLFAGHSRTCPDAGIQPKDGSGAQAEFIYPNAITIDLAGNIYVADNIPADYSGVKIKGSSIRKITPDGVVTRLAGSFSDTGYIDANGENARFRGISGLTVDDEGAIYGADTYNYVIRKITPSGDVSTFMDQYQGWVPFNIRHDAASGFYILYTNGISHVFTYKNLYGITRLPIWNSDRFSSFEWQVDKSNGDFYFFLASGDYRIDYKTGVFQHQIYKSNKASKEIYPNEASKELYPVGSLVGHDATIAVVSPGTLAILDNGRIIRAPSGISTP